MMIKSARGLIHSQLDKDKTESEHPVLFRPDSGLCAIAHLLHEQEFCFQPCKMRSDKVSPPVHQADGRIQDVSAEENKYSHI